MARHQQPREVAEIKGLTAHNPQRYRKEPPKNPLPLGNPPSHLTPETSAVWFELQAMVPPGVLTYSEALLMEILATLVVEFRSDPPAFAVGKFTHLVGIAARLGMSPSDRQRIGVEKPTEPDPLDEFLPT